MLILSHENVSTILCRLNPSSLLQTISNLLRRLKDHMPTTVKTRKTMVLMRMMMTLRLTAQLWKEFWTTQGLRYSVIITITVFMFALINVCFVLFWMQLLPLKVLIYQMPHFSGWRSSNDRSSNNCSTSFKVLACDYYVTTVFRVALGNKRATNSVISRSLVLRSIVLGIVLMHRNWPLPVSCSVDGLGL